MSNNGKSMLLGLFDTEVEVLFKQLSAGSYSLSYADSTHMADGQAIPLADVHVMRPEKQQDNEITGHPYFELSVHREMPASGGSNVKDKSANQKNAANTAEEIIKSWNKVQDVLRQSMLRLGMVQPVFNAKIFLDLTGLAKAPGAILIPDSNALSSGALHWLLRCLQQTRVWLSPVVMSLIQIQYRDEELKTIARNRSGGEKKQYQKMGQALRLRSFINSSLRFLRMYKGCYGVVSVDPQLMRYVRASGKGTGDPDSTDILEDRLFVEAVHQVMASTRGHAEVRFVTSDVMLAQILAIEAVPTLLLPLPTLTDDPIPCVSYDPFARAFSGCTLAQLVWDWTHVFSEIILLQESDQEPQEVARFSCYWPGKTDHDWEKDILNVSIRTDDVIKSSGDNGNNVASPGRIGHFSKAVIPEVSFVRVFRMGGKLLRGPAGLDELERRLCEEDKVSKDLIKAAAEILIRTGLASHSGGRLTPESPLRNLDEAFQDTDLDTVSSIMMSFQPYKALIDLLKEKKGQLEKKKIREALELKLMARPSMHSCERIIALCVLIGQAWHDGPFLRDGSRRPEDDVQFMRKFTEAFDRNALYETCSIEKLMITLCRISRMSPWAVSNRIKEFIGRNRLNAYQFETASAGLASGGNEILTGPLDSIDKVFVPTDRITIGDKPLLTVTRRS